MPIAASQHTHIWCPTCQAIQPKVNAHMLGTDETKTFHNPMDVLCSECFTIIATEYNDAEHKVTESLH
jgi:hypothetical protein